MRTLILLRHAKSSWADPGQADHDRPLNKRGRAAAPVVARWLEAEGLMPEQILCSSSVRTVETMRRMRRAVPALPEPELLPALYLADPPTMLRLVRALADDLSRVMLVAHEPGLSALAAHLSDANPAPGCARAFTHFPTAAVAVFQLEAGGWAAFGPNAARFVAFAVPRELAER